MTISKLTSSVVEDCEDCGFKTTTTQLISSACIDIELIVAFLTNVPDYTSTTIVLYGC